MFVQVLNLLNQCLCFCLSRVGSMFQQNKPTILHHQVKMFNYLRQSSQLNDIILRMFSVILVTSLSCYSQSFMKQTTSTNLAI